jgi:hypothetical protein
MLTKSFLATLAREVSAQQIDRVLAQRTRAGQLPTELRSLLIATICAGEFPSAARLPTMSRTDWYTYQDALGSAVFEGLGRIAGVAKGDPVPNSIGPLESLVAALYIHSGVVEAVGSLEHDAAMLLVESLKRQRELQKVLGVAFLVEMSGSEIAVCADSVLLEESKLFAVLLANDMAASYLNRARTRVPSPDEFRYLRTWLKELHSSASALAGRVAEIMKCFERWGYDL